jgi:nicotinamide mononucleotide transporter
MKNILKGWSTFEKIWLVVFTAIILTTGFIFKDTAIGIIASLTGVLCVVLVSQGKISNYFFGAINTALYAYISYKTGLYGETMLNAFFYLPIQFIGFYMWSKNMNKNEIGVSIVKAKKLDGKGWAWVIFTVGVVGIFYSLFLHQIGSQQANVDAFAVVLSITATLLMLKRYAEQWLLWIVVNVLTIILWANVFMHDGNSVTILVMWCAYLVNSVFGYIKWNKLAKQGEQ